VFVIVLSPYIEISIPKENKEKCLEAVPGLILMLKSDDVKHQNIAARAIGNICNASETKIPAIEQGVLEPLTSLLEQENDGVKDAAIMALTYIANAPETKCRVVEGGVLPPLFNLLENSADRIKDSAINILASLVLMEANHNPMVEACSFPTLVSGIEAGPASFRERCIFILSTLSYATLSREHLIAAGAVKVLKPLLEEQVGSQFSRELAVALVANICHIKAAQVQIVNEGLVPLLMQVANKEKEGKSDIKQRVGWVLQSVRHLVLRKKTVSTVAADSSTLLPPPPPTGVPTSTEANASERPSDVPPIPSVGNIDDICDDKAASKSDDSEVVSEIDVRMEGMRIESTNVASDQVTQLQESLGDNS
jgi:hypothetical protein